MNAPLKQFAERLVRTGEVQQFIRGLIREHHVDPQLILDATSDSDSDEMSDAVERRRLDYLERSSF